MMTYRDFWRLALAVAAGNVISYAASPLVKYAGALLAGAL